LKSSNKNGFYSQYLILYQESKVIRITCADRLKCYFHQGQLG
jgi:hypothetical protein